MAFCSECGKPLSDVARFCVNCGKPTVNLKKNESSGQDITSSSPAFRVREEIKLTPAIAARMSQALFIVPQPLLSDFQKLLLRLKITPMGLASGAEVNAIRARARSELNRLQGRVSYVCIIGDWDSVPPFEISNPIYSPYGNDQDEVCFSDAPYAGAAEVTDQAHPYALIPDLPLGRIPVMDIQVIERCLTQTYPKLMPSEALGFGITAKVWSRASHEIMSQAFPGKPFVRLSPHEAGSLDCTPHLLTPEWDQRHLMSKLQENPIHEGALLHFNVHGGSDGPEWVGQEEVGEACHPTIFSPHTVTDYRGAILLSEACYGGNMNYEGQPSIVEEFFMRGGLGFVGCSVIAYGNCTENISAADIIAAQFFKSLQQGMSFGAALSAAKVVVLASGSRSSYLVNLKTVISFNLYGAPWHFMQLERASPRSSPQASPEGGRTIDRIRNRVSSSLSGDASPSDQSLLSQIRQQYRDRIKIPRSWGRVDPQNSKLRLDEVVTDPEISDWLNAQDLSLDDLILEFFQFEDEEGYLLHAKHSTVKKSAFILALNAQGRLQQVITSKHWSHS